MSNFSNSSLTTSLRNFLKKLGAAKVKQLIYGIRSRLFFRGNNRYCPVCDQNSAAFDTFGHPPRKDAKCAWCGSLERHRFIWLYWKSGQVDMLDPKPGRKVLHVAPEVFLEPKLRKLLGDGYITADYLDPRADVRMDIQDIQFPDETFDVIYCSHVLEHVVDDRKAIAEFFRTLKLDGYAILMVPIVAEKTIEDPTITDPQERLRLFGQDDHVRLYGPDFIERLQEAGFDVKVINQEDILSPDEIVKMGVAIGAGEVHFCKKNRRRPIEPV